MYALQTEVIICIMKTKITKTEPWHDKTNKVTVCPAKTQISLGIHPVRVFAVHMKKDWVPSYPVSAQRRLIRLDMYRLNSIFAGRTVILLVLSCHGSNVYHMTYKSVSKWQFNRDQSGITSYQLRVKHISPTYIYNCLYIHTTYKMLTEIHGSWDTIYILTW